MHFTALYWVYIGIAMIVFEILTPGIFQLFFGLGAFSVALLVWLWPQMANGWQWLIFSILSIIYLILFRRTFKKVFIGQLEAVNALSDELIGKNAAVTTPITPDNAGRIELGGTFWQAEAQQEIAAGTTVRVTARNNLTLTVETVNKTN